jgi:hypothetical protein
MKTQVTIGTIWQDRGNQKTFEVTGFNRETGVIQLSSVGNGDGYKTMTESSLRKNYKLVALNMKEFKSSAAPPKEGTAAHETPETQEVTENIEPQEQPEVKTGRATSGRVQMEDGRVVAGSKFITEICQQLREDTYKVDSPIRWLLKETGQALLQAHNAKVVYGERITK